METSSAARDVVTGVQEALLAVAGVKDATVEEADGAPIGVRVELESGADERAVASSVQDVLSSYGMRSRLAPPRSKLEPVLPPPPPTILPVSREDAPPGEGPGVPGAGDAGVAEVSMAQRDDAVVIRVTDDEGHAVERVCRPGLVPVREAVVSAVAELRREDAPPPGIVLVDSRQSSGSEVVTVVLDVGRGELRAGAAVGESGRELALARAVWRALG